MKLVSSSIAITLVLALGLFSPNALANEVVKANVVSEQKTEMKQKVFMLVNINTASAKDLVKLKGIGLVKAQAIVDYRSVHGKFDSIEALTNVPGIGNKLIEHNRTRMIL